MPLPFPEDRPRLVVPLADGSDAELSPLLAADRDLLEEGMSQLSPESRFTRFGIGRGALTDSELDYLTHIDQRRHVAWGAVVAESAGGVARYILTEGAGCAEVAVTVVDRFQGKGLGTVLFEALTAVARADGLDTFCFEALPENAAMRQIIQGLPVQLGSEPGAVTGRISIAQLPETPIDAEFVALMEQIRSSG